MDISPLFQQFVRAYPEWKFWLAGTDLYGLAYNFVSQDVTVGQPENPQYVGQPNAGVLLYLPVPSISNVAFVGGLLSFQMQGNLWVCNGLKGKVSQQAL